ncbi:MAG: 3-isopropylmalate dehydratase [Betaproteobacteria bacterium]|nr:3-isopropylmalate dehydratase [Betaproteobacteria bacterium]
MELNYRGRCWKFGDNVGVDGDMMPLEFALQRETRLDVLAPYAMTGLDPDFPQKVRSHDIVVGGKRFAQGNPHIQGLLGLAAHNVGLVCESIPRGSLRNALNAGLPLLPACPGITQRLESGDELEVDFRSGHVRNLTQNWDQTFDPLPAALLDIILAGGWQPALKRRVEEMLARGAAQPT